MTLRTVKFVHRGNSASTRARGIPWCISITVMGLCLAVAVNATASQIQIVPSSTLVSTGDTVTTDISISGLGNGTSLGVFDLSLLYQNPFAFSFVNFGDPLLGDQLNLSGFGTLTDSTNTAGSLHLFELSFDDPATLNSLQAASFTLARVGFTALGPGTGLFSLSNVVLGDAIGNPLVPDSVVGASVTVGGGPGSAVPEPSTFVLVSSVLVLLVKRFS